MPRITPLEVADRMIEMVRETSVGGERGDTAQLVLYGAYLRGFRRFVAIRQLAGDGFGDEAIVLARSLLSMVARALWVSVPEDPSERELRWNRYYKRHLKDRLDIIEGFRITGLELDVDVGEIEAELRELEDVPNLPNDRDLLTQLGLEVYYERFYRFGSEYTHFSVHLAVDELRGVETVQLERPDAALADEALRYAILTYGVFLHMSERTIGHELGQRTLALIDEARILEADPQD